MTTLLLVPGLMCDAALWAPQVDALSDLADVRVVDVSSGETMAEMADLVLTEVPGPFALAGLSMGGYVCFEVVRRAPDRVQRLALLDTSARADTTEQTEHRQKVVDQVQTGGLAEAMDAAWPAMVTQARRSDEGLKAVFDAMAGRLGADVFAREQRAVMERADSRSLLAQIDCPTLVLCGADDALTPPELHAEMSEGIKGSVLVQVPQCGHLSTLDCPEPVSQAMRSWLTG